MMYDLILQNGFAADGTGSEPVRADVGIIGGRIAAVGTLDGDAARTLDVSGMIVCPGFIDPHSHSDASPFAPEVRDSKLRQGVTTEIVGNCGSSPMLWNKKGFDSVGAYLDGVDRNGFYNHIGALVGHSAIRAHVMGQDFREPAEPEMERMEELLTEALDGGAFGMSLGLIYPPSAFAGYHELLRLAKILAARGRILTVHMRDEGKGIMDAIREVLSIAQESGVQLEISHFKLMGREMWGKASEAIALVEEARAHGVKVNCDQYPYLASSTSLKSILPLEAQDGGTAMILERLTSPSKELLEKTGAHIESRGGAQRILVVSAGDHPEYAGKNLAEIAGTMGVSPTDAAIRLLIDGKLSVSCCYFSMNENDMLEIMKLPYVSVGSDGYSYPYEMNVSPHPRSFGTFPRFFETVREHRLMPIGRAVFKVTGLPAETFGLAERGFLRPGYYADLAVFDEKKIGSRADFLNPRVKPDGIGYVIVNGQIAVGQGELNPSRAGRALRRE